MNRVHQILLIFSTIAFSWLAMMAVHEFGHVINGWLSGGRVSKAVLNPLAFSRTDFTENPHPLFVAWGGGPWGMAIPLILWAIFRRFLKRYSFLAAFYAGFCLIANGAYLAGGSFFTGGGDDAGVILQHGGAMWQLMLFGLPAVAAGLWMWNGLGKYFGLGVAEGKVDRTATWIVSGLLVLTILGEIAVLGK